MVTHRKHTETKNKKSWAHFCPKTKKSARQKRHLTHRNQTTFEKRHLAINNKRHSVSTGTRAKKLRVPRESKLRRQRTKALSKKVNKGISGKRTQSEKITPRAKNNSVPKIHKNRKKQRRTQTPDQLPGHNSVLQNPNQDLLDQISHKEKFKQDPSDRRPPKLQKTPPAHPGQPPQRPKGKQRKRALIN